ncbi:xanthine dehydrogenase family protein molybdopterin-binding subunit [Egibacter rhizosphaerae]|uniref:Xanthine dehydrogenase family protein molybdopterin-binding subunit n=1 Tax=Egibacter rhizosphaerae TaxID=1670831 RepID=A0A411YJP9_9ACTN|nr:molybdopterin cofactor-binding domain-containing protein [Egibacter rhizosphaerae]QBI21424.1 xanthine dehydrogenase family protein molybdopterin-binding subunit [Egibacter rhizosphaerae]
MKHWGRGLAAIEYPTGMNLGGDPSQAWIKIKPDGRVDVFAGTVDIGQGSRTIHTQIVADTLGVPYEWVKMDVSNTDSSPVCMGTFASRGTFIGGNAVRVAAEQTRDALLAVASKELEVDAEDLEVVDGRVQVRGSPSQSLGVDEVAGSATYAHGTLITGSGGWMKPASEPDPETGECDPHAAISYAACVAEVEADDETGDVRVLRLIQAYDVGRAINPTMVEGQIEGGGAMGIGLGLLEEAYPYYPSTEHRGDRFGHYFPPAMKDTPVYENLIIENPSVDGPYGAKAIGEMANNAQPPAIAAAIHDALGVWINQMPASPERVLRALDEQQPREPRREGKWIVFDEDDSLATVSSTGGEGFIRVA